MDTSISLSTINELSVAEFVAAAQAERAAIKGRLYGWSFQSTVVEALLYAALQADLENIKYQVEESEIEEGMADQLACVNVMIDSDGERLYEVGFANSPGDDSGTVCKMADLATLEEWFDEEWVITEGEWSWAGPL